MKSLVKIEDTKQVVGVEYFGNTVIDEFIASRDPSENTAKSYRNVLRQMAKFFAANGITAPTTSDLDYFVGSLRAAGKADATRKMYVAVVKLFFAFLVKRGLYPDVADGMAKLNLRKVKTHKKQALSQAQAQKLLAAVEGDSIMARRNRAIIALALQTGVRCCEISRANVGDFNENEDGNGDYFLSVTGKGHTEADAVVRVAPAVAELILSYLELRGKVDDSEPLFTSTSNNIRWSKNAYGNRYSQQSVGKMIRAAMVKVGIIKVEKTAETENQSVKRTRSPYSAHSTRHFAATQAIKSGIDLRDVSEMLRHASIQTTLNYLHDISAKTRKAEFAVADALFGAA